MAEGKGAKEQLVNALIGLTAKQPYEKLTVQQISQAASVNRQNFYYHFKDKRALLRYTYYQKGLNYLLSAELTIRNWEESVLQMLRRMQEYHSFYLNTVQAEPEVLSKEFIALAKPLFVRLFEDVDQEGELSATDKDFYARFLAYGCGGILTDWLLGDAKEQPIAVAAQLFRFAKDIEFFAYRLYETDQD
ncbi:transcriptional regulator [Enterococcus florum]|uniref:Transcriptional regulator n=1 Tax=Enterococcus florum TaxID=2480627 RepID=A0A4P5PH79_9ENTE|nr:TetR/AcrR family transcriptional regulator [Enterococcus florum]GCF95781.1 transcriptional regulator [Enterococcus florum]